MWNKKEQNKPKKIDFQNDFLQYAINFIKPNGRVITLKESENAFFLASNNFQTEALDSSDLNLLKLQKKAQQEEILITIRHTFLENWNPSKKYDAIISYYQKLEKPLQKLMLQKCYDALENDGIFIGEFYAQTPINFAEKNSNEENLLYYLPEIYQILESFTCKIIKFSEELSNEGEAKESSLLRIIYKKS